MTKPAYKIEVWEPGGGSALHTITRKATIYCKEILTKAIGNFNFIVPTKMNGNYIYNDIDVNDTVKIWFGYDSISGNPNFIGKVLKVSAPLSRDTGFVRQISGLSQGEILLRRIKRNKWYSATAANTIVTDFANDLSLGTGDIGAETITVELNIDSATYFDLLKYVSDYWYDASNKIQKDFYVDTDNDLVWKDRPLRTVGVESFTVGEEILNYTVIEQIVPTVKNDIYVYGVRDKSNPSDKDSWTEGTASWTSSHTLGTDASDKKVGQYSVTATDASGLNTFINMYRSFTACACDRWKKYTKLKFWFRHILGGGQNPLGFEVRLYDGTDYFTRTTNFPPAAWYQHVFDLGEGTGWSTGGAGTPHWDTIDQFWIQLNWALAATSVIKIDELHLGDARFVGTATDAASITAYGQRDLEIVDDKLTSDDDCAQRAEAIKMERKDAPKEIILTVHGNTNVLVGDRLSMTIPAENISGVNFDVTTVEHMIDDQGFSTRATMINSAAIRKTLSVNVVDKLADTRQSVKELGRNEQFVG